MARKVITLIDDYDGTSMAKETIWFPLHSVS